MCFIFSWQKLLGKEKEICIANTILNTMARKGKWFFVAKHMSDTGYSS
jgi:hypothetical protein